MTTQIIDLTPQAILKRLDMILTELLALRREVQAMTEIQLETDLITEETEQAETTLKPLLVLDGFMPDGWRDEIYS